MILIENIIKASYKIAKSILKNKHPKELDEISVLSDDQKNEVLNELKNAKTYLHRIEIQKQLNQKKGWERIERQIEKPVYSLNYLKYAAAAAVVFFVAASYFYFNSQSELSAPTNPVVVNKPIQPGTDKATLVLGNGKTILLGQGNTYNANGISANGKNITYADSNTKIEYNYLTIPRAGQFQLQLADGTKVWLNSDSQLKFPNQFVEGKARNVELVYGEAYFEVSPSTAHKGSHFNVVTKGQNVEVLGTQFNIKAYNDETNIVTTLVEGKVELSNKTKRVALIPNQQAKNNILTNSLQTKSVDVYNYIAWKEGIFSFEEMPLKDIMKELERWYDVQVVFKNKKSENLVFSGVFHKNLSIEQILNLINKTKNVAYDIDKKTVTLK